MSLRNYLGRRLRLLELPSNIYGQTPNPTLVNRTIDPATGQFVYQLTAEGESALKDGEADRKRLFPKQSVRPAKQNH